MDELTCGVSSLHEWSVVAVRRVGLLGRGEKYKLEALSGLR